MLKEFEISQKKFSLRDTKAELAEPPPHGSRPIIQLHDNMVQFSYSISYSTMPQHSAIRFAQPKRYGHGTHNSLIGLR